jgi:hypothetical protein
MHLGYKSINRFNISDHSLCTLYSFVGDMVDAHSFTPFPPLLSALLAKHKTVLATRSGEHGIVRAKEL